MKIYLLIFSIVIIFFNIKKKIENFSGKKIKIFIINLDKDWKRMKEVDIEMKENNLSMKDYQQLKVLN